VGPYCHACGQDEHEVPRGFFGFVRAQVLQLVGYDARLWRSLYALLLRPGELTAEFMGGRRARYLQPISIYLLIAGAFFLIHTLRPFVSFDPARHTMVSRLRSVTVGGDLGAPELARLSAAGVSLEVFGERFAATVSTLMPVFLLGSVLLFAAGLWLLYRRYPGGSATHAVFALHWSSTWLALTALDRLLSPLGMAGRAAGTVASLSAVAWLFVALRRVYGRGWPGTAAGGLLLLAWFLVVIALWQLAVLLVAVRMAA
jgi:hypothetical protein